MIGKGKMEKPLMGEMREKLWPTCGNSHERIGEERNQADIRQNAWDLSFSLLFIIFYRIIVFIFIFNSNNMYFSDIL